MRLLEFDEKSFTLLGVKTFMADLHAANKGGTLEWRLEYDFGAKFGMSDLSAASFEALAESMAKEGSPLWHEYKGQGDGALFCTAYSSVTAPFAPIYPCEACEGACKASFLTLLNGTNVMG